MAVVQISAYRYVGLAGDTKPTASPVPIRGAVFVETDTGLSFMWSGTAWVNVTAGARA